jgi:hypothetical protein
MKKTIISLALAFLGIANLYAVKAKPGIAKIMLADGTMHVLPCMATKPSTTTCCWTVRPYGKPKTENTKR